MNYIYYELKFNDDIIKPGTLLKMKNRRYAHTYLCHVHFLEDDKTFVVTKDDRGQLRSFHISKIDRIVKLKRSRYGKPTRNP